MVVNLRAKKRLVSRVLGVGANRVKFDSDHLDDVVTFEVFFLQIQSK